MEKIIDFSSLISLCNVIYDHLKSHCQSAKEIPP